MSILTYLALESSPPPPPKPFFVGPTTGLRTEGCYLSATDNCDGPLSREHYLSRAILTQMNGLKVVGPTWAGPTGKVVGVESLTARILCTRHNSGLTELDTAAAEVFRALRGPTSQQIVNGALFERWILKFAVGGIWANFLTTRVPNEPPPPMTIEATNWLIGNRHLPIGYGLHIVHNDYSVQARHGQLPLPDIDKTIKAVPCINEHGQMVALSLSLCGISFLLVLGDEDSWQKYTPYKVTYRPSQMELQRRDATVLIKFDYLGLPHGGEVAAKYRG